MIHGSPTTEFCYETYTDEGDVFFVLEQSIARGMNTKFGKSDKPCAWSVFVCLFNFLLDIPIMRERSCASDLRRLRHCTRYQVHPYPDELVILPPPIGDCHHVASMRGLDALLFVASPILEYLTHERVSGVSGGVFFCYCSSAFVRAVLGGIQLNVACGVPSKV